MQHYGQREKVAKINVDYQLNMKSKKNVQYIREGKIVIPIFLEDNKDHVLDHIDTYIEEAIKDTDDELLGGVIVAEFLGVCHYFDFIVMEEGEKRCQQVLIKRNLRNLLGYGYMEMRCLKCGNTLVLQIQTQMIESN